MLNQTYKGFSLFSDLEDENLQTFNRARILTNIAQDNTQGGKINIKGASLILGYFQQIPERARERVKEEFSRLMKKEGYALVV